MDDNKRGEHGRREKDSDTEKQSKKHTGKDIRNPDRPKRDSKRQHNKDSRIRDKHRNHLGQFRFSPDDPRDWKIDKVVKVEKIELPEKYRTPGKVPVMQQSNIGSCVAHSISVALGYGEYKANFQFHNDYSRGFVYGNRLDTDYQGEGMITREAISQVQKCGDCLYPTFPWNETYPKVKNRIEDNQEEYFEEAQNYKILNYVRCTTQQEIKEAIYYLGAVVIAINIYPGFGKNPTIPRPNELSQGGHAMTLVGWNKTGWIVQNSWSASWGDKGYCYLPYEYPIKEVWGLTIDETLPPSPKKGFWSTIGQFLWSTIQIIGGFFYNGYFFVKDLLSKDSREKEEKEEKEEE